MDLPEAVMLVVFDVRKSNPDFSAHQAIASAQDVNRGDVVNTGGDLETAYLAVIDHARSSEAREKLEKAIDEYTYRVMPTRTSGRLSPMAQDVIMHARNCNNGEKGGWVVDTDNMTLADLIGRGLVGFRVDDKPVLTELGEHARTLIPML